VPVSTYGSVSDPNVIESAVVITNTYTLSEASTKRSSLSPLTSVTATYYDTKTVTATVPSSVGLPGTLLPTSGGNTQTVNDQASSSVLSSTLEILKSTTPLDLSKSLEMTGSRQNTFNSDLGPNASRTELPTGSIETRPTQVALLTSTIQGTSFANVSSSLSAATSVQPAISASIFSTATMSNTSSSFLKQPDLSSANIGTSSLEGAFTTGLGTASSAQTVTSTGSLPGSSQFSSSSDASSQILSPSNEAPTSFVQSSPAMGSDTSAPNPPSSMIDTTSTNSLITASATDPGSESSFPAATSVDINLSSSTQDDLSAGTTASVTDTITITSAPVASSMETTLLIIVTDSSTLSHTILATESSAGTLLLATSSMDNTPAFSMQDVSSSSHTLLVTDITTELSPSATSSPVVSLGSAISVNTSPTSVSTMDTAISPLSRDFTKSIHITAIPPPLGSPLMPSTVLVTVAPSIVVSGVCNTIVLGLQTLIPGAAPIITDSHTISLEAANLLIVDEATFHLCELPPTSTDSGLVTSTMTTLPPGFSVEDNPAITVNGWLTTADSQGVPTVVPVLVCPHCGGGHGGFILWKLPELSHIKFKFSIPTIPKFPSFSLPCIKILGVKVAGNCDPVTDNNDDQSNDQSSTTTDSTTTTPHADGSTRPEWKITESSTTILSSSSECKSSETASDCLIFGNAFSTSGTRTTTYYSIGCSETSTGCTATGITSTIISTFSYCEMTYTPFSTVEIVSATPIARKHKRVTETTQTCGVCQTSNLSPAITGTAANGEDEDSGDPNSIPRRWLAGKAHSLHHLEKRWSAKTYMRLGSIGSDCALATPEGLSVTKPAYRGAKQFISAELKGRLQPKSFSSISRWYSQTSMGDCIPLVTKIDAKQMTAAPNYGGNGSPSMDHACKFLTRMHCLGLTLLDEVQFLTSFFANIIDPTGSSPGSLDCDIFNRIFFATVGTSADPQNRLEPIFNALPSDDNPDFVLMTSYLNEHAKGQASHSRLFGIKKAVPCYKPI
jgi:hypothetical protein